MSTLNRDTSHWATQSQAIWERWHRLAGYILPPQVFIAAEGLISPPGSDPIGNAPSMDNLHLATSFLRQALVFYPLDQNLLKYALHLRVLVPSTPGFSTWLRALERFYRTNPNHFVDSMLISSEIGDQKSEEILEQFISKGKIGALCAALHVFWATGNWEIVREISIKLLTLPEAPFIAPLVAWSAWSAGEKDLAEAWLRLSEPPSFLTYNLKAEMALQCGNIKEARQHWQQSLLWDPNQPHLFHRYWESQRPRGIQNGNNHKNVHIVLYTYNKLETTLTTLKSLLASDIGSSPVTVLNNGSTSFSSEELDRAVQAVAQGREIKIIHLPVNIGAPAARNWLWHLPEVKRCDYVAFLDDDVLVPPNWLNLYMETLELFPDAVVVGPRVLNPGTLPTIQYVYRFFQQVGHHKIIFTPPNPMFHDLGQFSYRRPCLSVMGCCHLFNRRRWEALNLPDFDIRFSPSQVDDLEHDLQIWKGGGQVIYDGRVGVVHLQDAGKAAPNSRSSWGHVWGNHMKMESKFTGEELEAMNLNVIEADEAFHHQVREDVKDELHF